LTDTVTISLVGALTTVIISIINAFIALRSAERGRVIHNNVIETKVAVAELKEQTDGLATALVKVTGQAEHAKGLKEGKAEERAEEHLRQQKPRSARQIAEDRS
jgi:hypothetical protein